MERKNTYTVSALMRDWIKSEFGDMIRTEGWSTAQCERAIGKMYEGGVAQWYLDVVGRPKGDTRDADPQVRERLQLRETLGRDIPLSVHDKIIYQDWIDDDEYLLTVERPIVEEQAAGRLHVSKVFLVTYVFVGDDLRLAETHRERMTGFEPETYAGAVPVLTPERYRDKINEFLDCYRPGTAKAPMDGPYSENNSKHWDLYVNLRNLGLGEE